MTVVCDDFNTCANASPPFDQSSGQPHRRRARSRRLRARAARSSTPTSRHPDRPHATDFPVNVNVTDPRFFSVSDLDVALDLTHPNLAELSAVLIPPVGSNLPPLTLFHNQTNAAGRRSPTSGITGANLGITPAAPGSARSSTTRPPGRSPTGPPRRPTSATSGPRAGSLDRRATPARRRRPGGRINGDLDPADHRLPQQRHSAAAPVLNELVTLDLHLGPDRRQSDTPIADDRSSAGRSPGRIRPRRRPRPGDRPRHLDRLGQHPGGLQPAPGPALRRVRRPHYRLHHQPGRQHRHLPGGLRRRRPDLDRLPTARHVRRRLRRRPVNDDNGDRPTGSPSRHRVDSGRPQFQPSIAVDQTTGTLVMSWLDTRNDAARARVATYVTTSIDGGQTFSPQTSTPTSRRRPPTRSPADGHPRPDPRQRVGGQPAHRGDLRLRHHQGLAVYGGHDLPDLGEQPERRRPTAKQPARHP